MIDFLWRGNQPDRASRGNTTSKLRKKIHKAKSYTFTQIIKQAWECSVLRISTECAYWPSYRKRRQKSIWNFTYGKTINLRLRRTTVKGTFYPKSSRPTLVILMTRTSRLSKKTTKSLRKYSETVLKIDFIFHLIFAFIHILYTFSE